MDNQEVTRIISQMPIGFEDTLVDGWYFKIKEIMHYKGDGYKISARFS